MRAAYSLIFLLFAGCAGDSANSIDPSDADADADADSDADVWHPLVPEEFWYLWNVDSSCTKSEWDGGGQGKQVYVVTSNAALDDQGNYTATEKWYYFNDTGDYSDDKVDTIEYTAAVSDIYSPHSLDVSSAELVIDGTRIATDSQTGDDHDDEFIFAFEAQTANDDWNPDGNVLVHYWPLGGGWGGDDGPGRRRDFARGTYFPEHTDDPSKFFPGTFEWVGDFCR